MTVTLQLFSTSHCHLCEQAELLVSSLGAKYKFEWLAVEIIDDATLFERYAIRIPVLKNLNTNQEIAWPFTTSDIQILLTS